MRNTANLQREYKRYPQTVSLVPRMRHTDGSADTQARAAAMRRPFGSAPRKLQDWR